MTHAATTTRRIFERHDASFGSAFEATNILEERRGRHQDILVFDTERHGRVLFLDGLTMLTEHTHHVYHEVMAHTALSCVREPRRVLIIGGGDGGVATEACKWDQVQSITVAELDSDVVEVSQRWFPDVAAGFDDPRVTVRIGDGAAFLAEHDAAFDVIIIDCTDVCTDAVDEEASLVASPLATDEFYADVARALTPAGCAIQVLGSPIFYRAGMGRLLPRLNRVWPQFKTVSYAAPFYISGLWVSGLMGGAHADLTPKTLPVAPSALHHVTLDVARAGLAAPLSIQRLIQPGAEP